MCLAAPFANCTPLAYGISPSFSFPQQPYWGQQSTFDDTQMQPVCGHNSGLDSHRSALLLLRLQQHGCEVKNENVLKPGSCVLLNCSFRNPSSYPHRTALTYVKARTCFELMQPVVEPNGIRPHSQVFPLHMSCI